MPVPVSQQYPELLHYTTLAGITGILSSGCIWATDASCLNDSSEITHFFDERLSDLVIDETRKYAIEYARIPANLAQMLRDGGIDKIVSDEARGLVSALRSATLSMNKPFVLSLSGTSDVRVNESGLLSQWRGYGNDGGYALVLDTKALEGMLIQEAGSHHYMHVQIGDVFYQGIDPSIQPATIDFGEYESVVRKGVYGLLRGSTVEETNGFYEAVTSLSCLCKHWGFWEEHEVRVVAVPANEGMIDTEEANTLPRKEVKSLIRRESLLPYIELFAHLRLGSPKGKLPIKRIIVGPHKNGAAHETVVRDLLTSNGYKLEVTRSKIPYIG